MNRMRRWTSSKYMYLVTFPKIAATSERQQWQQQQPVWTVSGAAIPESLLASTDCLIRCSCVSNFGIPDRQRKKQPPSTIQRTLKSDRHDPRNTKEIKDRTFPRGLILADHCQLLPVKDGGMTCFRTNIHHNRCCSTSICHTGVPYLLSQVPSSSKAILFCL